MALRDVLLPEFDHEMAVTRRVLERVPYADASWKPHDRSMSLGALAAHLATIPSWAPVIMHGESYDMPAAVDATRHVPGDSAALLLEFDRNVAAARRVIAESSDAQLLQPWTLKSGGHVLFTQPKAGVLRSFLLSHSIHHRGQMSVYLRLRGVLVPSIYGPSADER